MPIYDYLCSNCRHLTEVIHGINDAGPRFCPACGADGTMRKAMSTPNVHFKGSGWAKKDRSSTSAARTKAAASSSSKDGGSSDGGSSDGGSSDGGSKDGGSKDGGSDDTSSTADKSTPALGPAKKSAEPAGSSEN